MYKNTLIFIKIAETTTKLGKLKWQVPHHLPTEGILSLKARSSHVYNLVTI